MAYDDGQDFEVDPQRRNGNTGVFGGLGFGPGGAAPKDFVSTPQQGAFGPAGAVPEGFVSSGQQGAPFDRTAFRDSWMGTGNNVGAQDALLKQYGINLSGNGTGTLPSGEIMDLRRGARAGDNTAQWMGVGQMQNGQASYYQPGGGAGGGSGGAGGGGGGGLDGAFRDALLKSMNGANAPFDPNDPRNAAQQGAYNRQRDRAAQNERAALAERSAFNGLNSGGAGSGAFETGIQGIHEQAGQDEAGYGAHLAEQDYQAKRQDLAHALDLANAVGARQEAAAIQMQIAQMDNQYRYSALGQQQGQFEDQMAYNYTDMTAQNNRANLLAGLGGGGF